MAKTFLKLTFISTLAAIMSACSGGGAGNEGLVTDLNLQIAIVSGNNQTSSGSTFQDPLAIRVTNSLGEPVQDISVTFSETTSFGATLPIPNVTTDASGLAFTTVTAPSTSDITFTIEARIDSAPDGKVDFTLASDIGVDSIRFQAGFEPPNSYTINSSSPMSQFRVEALDENSNVLNISQGTIQLSISSGSYQLSGGTSATLVNGVATFGSVFYYRPETITLRATHVPTGLFVEKAVTVNPGAVSRTIALLPGQSHNPGVETFAEAVIGGPTTQTAGVPFNVEVRAVDDGFNTVATYTGSVGLTLSDSFATPPASANFTAGAHTFSTTFRAASSSQRVTPTSALTDTDSSDFGVDPNSVSQTALLLPGQTLLNGAPNITAAISGTATDQTAGVTFNVSAYALDDYFNVVNDNSTSISLSHTDPNATDNGPLTFAGGVASFNVTYALASSAITITSSSALATDNPSTNFNVLAGSAIGTIAVLPGQTHTPGVTTLAAAVTGSPTAQTVGTSFNVDIYAVDTNYNIVTAETGSVSVTTSDANDTHPAGQNFVAGQATFAITNTTAGSGTITPVTSLITDNVSSSYTINAGAATQIVTLLPGESLVPGQSSLAAAISGSPANQSVNNAFNITAIAVDAFFNQQTSSTVSVSIVTNDPNDTDPVAQNLVGGQATYSITNVTAGTRIITPSSSLSTNNPSTTYNVLPGTPVQTVVVLPGEALNPGQSTLGAAITGTPTVQAAGVSFNATVYAVDAFFNVVTTESGAVSLGTSDPNDTEPVASTFTSGQVTFSLTPVTTGTGLTATPSTSLTDNPSSGFDVTPGAAIQTIVVLPGQTHNEGVSSLASAVTGTPTAQNAGSGFNVTVKAVDAFFNTSTDSSTSVSLVTDDTNDTDPSSLVFSNGEITFTVTNVTAGTSRSMVAGTTFATNNTSSNYVVNAGTAIQTIVLLPGQTHNPGASSLALAVTGTPTTQVAASPFSASVYAVDSFFNIVTTESGAVGLTTSDANDTDPVASSFILGQASFSVSPVLAGTNFNVTPSTTFTDNVSSNYNVDAGATVGLIAILPGQTFNPGVSSLAAAVTGTPSTQAVGVAFNVSVFAVDSLYNRTNATDSVNLATSDSTDTDPAAQNLISGITTFNLTHTIATTGLTVTPSGGGYTANTSSSYDVNPGAATQSIVVLPGQTHVPGQSTLAAAVTGAPTSQNAAVSFNVNVYAVDAFFNIVPSETGVVSITTDDPNDTEPAATNFASGQATFSITNVTAAATATVTPSSSLGTNNASNNYTILPGTATQTIVVLPGQTHNPGAASLATAVSGTPTAQTAGATFSVDVYAVDAFYNIVTTSVNSVSIVTSDANDTDPAGVNFVSGQASFSITNVTAGSGQVITPSSAGLTANPSNSYVVNPGAATQLIVVMPGQTYNPGLATLATAVTGSPTAQAAGTNFNVDVRVVDNNFNTVVSNSDLVSITTSDANDTEPSAINFASGLAIFTVNNVTASSLNTITPSSGVLTANPSSNYVVGGGAATQLVVVLPGQTLTQGASSLATAVTGTPTTQTAGSTFNANVYAVDAFFNIDLTQTNSVSVTTNDANDTEPAGGNFVSGQATFAITNTTAGTALNVAPASTGLAANTSSNYTVVAGTVIQAIVVLPGEVLNSGVSTLTAAITGTPTIQSAGVSFNANVYAVDAFYNPDLTYTNSVSVITSDVNDTEPAATNFSAGQATFAITNVTAGSGQSITPVSAGISSISSELYTVNPNSVTQTIAVLPGQTYNPGSATLGAAVSGTPTTQAAGTNFNVDIRAVDAYFNTVTSVNSAVSVTTSDPSDTEPSASSFTSGLVTFAISPASIGSSLTLVAVSSFTDNTSSAYQVDPGGASQIIVILPGQTHNQGAASLAAAVTGTPTNQTAGSAFTATVKAVDSLFNTVSAVTQSVSLVTSDVNDSDPVAINFVGGQATFTITNATAGAGQILTPSSSGLTANVSSSYTVDPGAAVQTIAILPGQTHNPGQATLGAAVTGIPTAQTTGGSFSVDIYAVDALYNIVTSVGSAVSLSTSDPNDTEPSASTFASGQVTFSVTNITSGSQTVVASSVLSTDVTSTNFTVNTGTATQAIAVLPGQTFSPGKTSLAAAVTGAVTTQTAGVSFNATIYAVDAYYNTVTSVSSAVGVTTSDVNDIEPSSSTFSSGQATFSITNVTSGAGQFVTTAATGLTNNASTTYSVVPGSATRLIAILPGQTHNEGVASIAAAVTGSPTPQTAGVGFAVTVKAVDAAFNTVTSYSGAVGLATSDINDSDPAAGTFTSGVETFSVTNTTSGSSLTVTPSASGLTAFTSTAYTLNAAAATQTIAILPGQTHNQGVASLGAAITGTPTAQTAGTAFSVTVRAVDAFYNTNTTVNSAVSLTTDDANDTEPSASTFSSGERAFLVTNVTAGTRSLTASSSLTDNTSSNYTLNPGAASQLIVVMPGQTYTPGLATVGTAVSGTPTTQTAGTAFNVDVYAVDSLFNTVTSHAGSVNVVTSDANDTDPSAVSFISGQATFTITNVTRGLTQQITPSSTGLTANASDVYAVDPAAASQTIVLLPGQTHNQGAANLAAAVTGTPTTQTAGSSFNITVRSVDPYFNTANDSSTVITATTDDVNDTDPTPSAVTLGEVTYAVTNTTSGTRSISTSSVLSTNNSSSTYTVNPGSATQSIVLMPGQAYNPGASSLAAAVTGTPTAQSAGTSFSITVRAVDAFFNTVPSETGSVLVSTDDPNDVEPSSSNFVSGVETFTITNVTTGTRTISPVTGLSTENNSSNYTVNPGSPTQVIVVMPGQTYNPGAASLAAAVTGTPTAQVAGTAFNVDVRAVDAAFNTVTAETGAVSIVTNDANDTDPAGTNFTAGLATFSVTNVTASASRAITPSSGALTANNSSTYTLNAGAATQTIAILPGQSYVQGVASLALAVTGTPTNQTAGTAFNVEVRAVDAFFNTNTSEVGAVTLTTSDANDTDPAAANFTAGVNTFSVTNTTASSGQTVSATSGALTVNASSTYDVNPGAATQTIAIMPGQTHVPGTSSLAAAVTGSPSAQVAGNAFNVVIRAVDGSFNTVTSASGSVSVATSDANDTDPAASSFTSGEVTFSVTNTTAGASQTITPTAAGLSTNVSSAYTVNPNTATQTIVILPGQTHVPGTGSLAAAVTGTPTVQTAGTSFNITVRAVDAFFNTTSDTSAVSVTTDDVNDTDPAAANFIAGSVNFSITNTTAGIRSITPSSTLSTDNASNSYTLNPGAATQLIVVMPGQTHVPGTASVAAAVTGTPTVQTAGVAFNAEVKAVDANFNTVTSESGSVSVSTNDPNDVEPTGSNFSSGSVTFSVTNVTASSTSRITPASGALTANNSSDYSVIAGSATQLIVILPGQTHNQGQVSLANAVTGTPTAQTAGTSFNVTVRAVDAAFNTVTSQSGAVSVSTNDANDTDPAAGSFTSGEATFTITNVTAGATRVITPSGGGLTANNSSNYTVNAGAATQLIVVMPGQTYNPGTGSLAAAVTGSPTAQTAGGTFSVDVRAVDAFFNTDTSEVGVVSVATSDINDTEPSSANFVAGLQSFSITNVTASGSATITPTSGALTANVSSTYVINTGAASQLIVVLPGQTHVPGAGSLAAAVTGSASTQIAGVAFNAVVKAVDANFNTVTSETGAISAATSDTNDTNPPGSNFVAGEVTFSITNTTAGASQTITPTAAGLTSNASSNYTVNPSTVNQLIVVLPGQTYVPGAASLAAAVTGSPTNQNVGAAFSVDVRAVDAFFNTVTSYNSAVSVASSDPNDTDPAASTFSSGLVNFNITNTTSGTGQTITPTSGALTANVSSAYAVNSGAASQLIVVLPGQTYVPGAASLAAAVTGSPSTQTAGVSFNVDVRAVDSFFNTVTSENGTVSVATNDANDIEPSASTFSSGLVTFAISNVTASGSSTITPTSGALTANVSSTYSVVAGAATQLIVVLPGQTHNQGQVSLANAVTGTPTAQTAGTSFNVTVRAVDAAFNTVTTESGAVSVATNDANDTDPGASSFTSGSATFTITNVTANTASNITPTSGALTANVSSNYTVGSAAATQLIVVMPGQTYNPGTGSLAAAVTGTPTTQTSAVSFNVTVRAVDVYFNTDTSQTGAVSIVTSDANDTDPSASTFTAGAHTFSVTNLTAGTGQTITPTSGALTANASSAYIVNAASATQVIAVLPGQTHVEGATSLAAAITGTPTDQVAGTSFNVVVTAVDANFNRVGSSTNNIALATSDVNDTDPSNQNLVAGQTTFSVTNTTASVGQTVTPSTGGLSTNISSAYDVNPGSVDQLIVVMPGQTYVPGSANLAAAVTGTPTAQTAGTGFSVDVRAVDANFNTVTSYNAAVSVTTSDTNDTEPSGTIFSAGLRAFTITNVTAGSGLTISPASGALTVNPSSGYVVNPGAATQLIVVMPGQTYVPGAGSLAAAVTGTPTTQTAGVAFNADVRAVDAFFNTDTSQSSTVSVTTNDANDIEPSASSFTSGLATFSVTNVTASASSTITPASGALTANVSSNYSVIAGAANQLIVVLPGQTHNQGQVSLANAVTGSPTAQLAGTSFNVTVKVVDAAFNTVTTNTDAVSVSTNDANDTEPGASSFTSGSATFTITNVTASTTSNITPASGALTVNNSTNYTVNAGSPTQLIVILPGQSYNPGTGSLAAAVTGSPTAQTAGAAFNVDVRAVDAFFNTNTSETGAVSIATSDANDTEPSASNFAAGVETFSVTNVTASGGQTITPTSGALTANVSTAYTVNPGAATQLIAILPGQTHSPGQASLAAAVTGSPTIQVAGGAFNVVVRAVDAAFNTVTSSTDSVTLATSDANDTDPSAQNLVSGEATYSVTNTTAGSGNTVSPSAGGLSTNASTAYTINPAAVGQLIVVMPGQTYNPGTGSLAAAVTGTPTAQTAGTSFSVDVRAVDAFFNTVTSESSAVSVTTSDGNDTDPGAATFSSGLASFSITNTTAGTGQTINPSSGALTANASSGYTVNPGAATQLAVILPGQSYNPGLGSIFAAVTGTPTTQTAGTGFSVDVRAVDAFFNTVTSENGSVSIATNDANDVDPSGSTFTSGLATFTVTNVTASSTSQITPTSGALTANVSSNYNVIAGAASQLIVILPGQTHNQGQISLAAAVTGAPTAQTAGTGFTVTVRAVDAAFNTVTTETSAVSITTDDSNDTDPGASTFSSGEATFSVTNVTAGASRSITPSSGALTANNSTNYVVNAGSATQLIVVLPGQTYNPGTGSVAAAVTGSPTAQTAATGFSAEVRAVDAFFNTDTGETGAVSIATSDSNDTDPSASAFTAGVETFTVTNVTAGAGQTVTPTSGGLSANVSSTYTVNPGAVVASIVILPGQTYVPGVSSLAAAVTGSPTGQSVNTAFNAEVRAVDANYNTVTGESSAVSVATDDPNDTDPAASTFSSGVATFSVTNLTAGTRSISPSTSFTTDNVSSNYTLNAGTATQLIVIMPGQSYNPGAASVAAAVTGSPTAQAAGTGFSVDVRAVDAFFNTVTSYNSTVSVATSDANDTEPSSSTFSSGLESFTITNTTAGGSQTITPTSGALTANASSNYTVNPGSATQLIVVLPGQTYVPGTGSLAAAVTGSPSTQTAGVAFSVDVRAVDAFYNTDTSEGGTVSVSTNDANDIEPGSSSFSSGLASFSISNVTSGSTQTITPASGALTANISNTYSVVAGPATQLIVIMPGQTHNQGQATLGAAVTGTPTAQTAGTSFNVTVKAVDAAFNTVTSASNTVTVATSDVNDTDPASSALSLGVQTYSITNVTAGTGLNMTPSATGLTSNNSSNYDVNPGTATQTIVVLPGQTHVPGQGSLAAAVTGSPTAQAAGTGFSVDVRAVDAFFNTVTGETGAISITTDDTNDTDPATPTNFTAGLATYTVNNVTAGSRSITPTSALTDNASSAYTVNPGAASQTIAVLPGQTYNPGAASLAAAVTGSPTAQTVNSSFSVEIRAVDTLFNTVTSESGAVSLTTDDPNDTEPSSSTFSSGVVNFSVTNVTSGVRTTTATTAYTDNVSSNYTVNPGAVTQTIAVLPGQSYVPGVSTLGAAVTGTPTAQTVGTSFNVTVRAVDAFFNTVASETGAVSVASNDANDTDPAASNFTAGQVTFAIDNRTASTSSTITPSSAFADNVSSTYTANPSAVTQVIVVMPGQAYNPGTASLAAAVTGTPTNQNVGVSFNATVRAVDVYFNTVTTNTDAVSVVSSDPNDTDPASSNFASGIETFAITNTTRSATNTITPTSGALTANASDVYATLAGSPSQSIVVLPGQSHVEGVASAAAAVSGSASNQVAGTGFTANVRAVDSFFNLTSDSVTAISVTTDDTNDTDPSAGTFSSGQANFTITNRTAGTRSITPVSAFGTNNLSSNYTLNPDTVSQVIAILPGETYTPGAANLAAAVSGSPTGQVAGTAFNVEVRAVDAFFNTVSSETGAVSLATDDANDTDPAASTFTAGVETFSVTNVTVSGARNVTPTSGALTSNVSNNYAVSPAAATQLIVVLPGQTHVEGQASLAAAVTGSATAQTAGTGFTATVKAVDAFFNTVTSNTDAVSVTTSDANDTHPGAGTFASGVETFTITNTTAGGSQTVSPSSGALTVNASSTYTVNPGAAANLLVILPGQTQVPGVGTLAAAISGTGTTQTAGSAFNVNVVSTDAFFNTVNDNATSITVSTDDINDTHPGAQTLSSGSATFSITNTTAGATRNITPTGSGYTGNTSENYQVDPGAAANIIVVLPGETHVPGVSTFGAAVTGSPSSQTSGSAFNVDVIATDAFFNTRTSDSTTSASVTTNDPNDTHPSDQTLVAGDIVFSITNYLAGTNSRTISAAGTGYATVASNTFTVLPVNPADPSGWTMASPANSSTSNDFTPQISGSGLAIENSSTIEIFDDGGTCGTIIGSATITGGVFTVSNITYNQDGSDDGAKAFYGLIRNPSGLASNCVNLSLGYTLDTVISAPTSLVMQSPASSLGNSTTPTVTVNGVGNGDTVRIYTDASCSTLRGTASSTGTSVDVTVSVALPSDAAYTFYANRTDSGGYSSPCSTANVAYTLETVNPDPPNTPTLASVWTTDTTAAPTFGWTAFAPPTADLSGYDAGIGTTSGGVELVAFTDIGNNLSHDFTGLSMAECTNYYPTVRARDNAGNVSTQLTVGTPFQADGTDPTFTGTVNITVDGNVTTANTADWSVATDNCSFSHYELAIGTSSGGTQTLNWLNIGTVTTYQAQNGVDSVTLALSPGVDYYTSIRAYDASGRFTELNSAVWRIPPPDAITDLSVATTIRYAAELNWTAPTNTSGAPITDYFVQYRENGTTNWITFYDGVNLENAVYVTGLKPNTLYDFQVFSYNGATSATSGVSTGTTKNDLDIFNSPYTAMNVGGAVRSQVTAIWDGTVIEFKNSSYVTTSTQTLTKGATYSFTSAQYDIITANKPIYTAGEKGTVNNSGAAAANVTWSPMSWAGREFTFNSIRSNPQEIYIYAVEAANITVKQGTTDLVTPFALTAGATTTVSYSVFGSVQVASDGNILAYHAANGTTDAKPLVPAYDDIIGFPSNSMRLTTSVDNTSYSFFHSNDTTGGGTINANAQVTISPQGSPTSLYQSNALRIQTNQNASGASFADSNGSAASPFLPVNLMRKTYVINVAADYVAFASTQAGTITALDFNDNVVATLTLSRSGSLAAAPYFARTGATGAGVRFFSTVPMAAWYQPDNTTSNAGRRDETILYGTNDTTDNGGINLTVGPNSFANTALWYDGADKLSMYQDDLCTTDMSLDGDSVGCWLDRSGNNRHATQAAGNKPVWTETGGVSSMSSITFNGGTNYLGFDQTFLNGTNYTILAVGQRSSVSTDNYIIGTQSTTADQGLHFGYSTDTQARLSQVGTDLNLTVPGQATEAIGLLTGVFDGAGKGLYDYTGSATNSDTNSLSSAGSGVIGLGNSTGGFNGQISEIMVFDRALTTTEQEKMEGYLACKWDIRDKLDGAHPYYNATGTNDLNCP